MKCRTTPNQTVRSVPNHTDGQPMRFKHSIQNANKNETREKKREEERERERKGEKEMDEGKIRPIWSDRPGAFEKFFYNKLT